MMLEEVEALLCSSRVIALDGSRFCAFSTCLSLVSFTKAADNFKAFVRDVNDMAECSVLGN